MTSLYRRIRALSILCCFLFSLKSSKGDISHRIISIPSPPALLIKNFSDLSHGLRKKLRVSHRISSVSSPSIPLIKNLSDLRHGLRNNFRVPHQVISIPSPPTSLIKSIRNCARTVGCYFGMSEELMSSQNYHRRDKEKEAMELLLAQYREGLEAYREEVRELRKDVRKLQGIEDGELDEELPKRGGREWDQVGLEIERWAQKIADEEIKDGENGWKNIMVSNLCSHYNKDGRIKCYLKWIKDSRGDMADQADDAVYPCIRVETTIDAPIENVCGYLADEKSLTDYNALVQKHRDLEDITPHSKICWGQSPKILFIKPRDFVTFCQIRWRQDGTQVVVNQACNHEDYDYIEKKNKNSRKAYALRGANFISPHPEDSNKTNLCIIAHANPGPDISPYWCRVAVNQLVQMEPFKLFYKINQFAQQYKPSKDNKVDPVSSSPDRSKRPGGLSQMGYACFWPDGCGLEEKVPPLQNGVSSESEIDEEGRSLPQSDIVSELENDEEGMPLPKNDVVSELENYGENVPLPQNDVVSKLENDEDKVPSQNDVVPELETDKDGAPLPQNDVVSELENLKDNEDNSSSERELVTQSI